MNDPLRTLAALCSTGQGQTVKVGGWGSETAVVYMPWRVIAQRLVGTDGVVLLNIGRG